jgi:hypothetical protein
MREPGTISFQGRKTMVATGSLRQVASQKAMEGEGPLETLDE